MQLVIDEQKGAGEELERDGDDDIHLQLVIIREEVMEEMSKEMMRKRLSETETEMETAISTYTAILREINFWSDCLIGLSGFW